MTSGNSELQIRQWVALVYVPVADEPEFPSLTNLPFYI